MKFLPAVAFLLLLGGAGEMRAEEAPRKAMVAVRVNPTAPKIDGVLDDEAWQHAPRFGGFTQRIPDEGKPATDSTTVQFAYDDEALYAAIMCYDQDPEKIVARLNRRDQGYQNTDWVHLSIDSKDHFVYGDLESQVFDLTGRCNWIFTPDLTLQLYLQPFVAVGDYRNFKELARPKSYTFTPYPGLSFNPDFRRRSLRSNLVLRWEYLPGSTLFLVWSPARQDRAANPELQPWSNLRRSFADEGSNLFLVKLSYWMNI